MNRQILHIALPSIVTNVTVPLLAFVDTTIAGHLDSPVYLAAIAIGSLLFNMAYWLFGFLRAATGGLTAQAHGALEDGEAQAILLRSLFVAGVAGIGLILFSTPWLWAAWQLIPAEPEVKEIATSYFYILIWGAPAVLGLYSLTGWMLGMQNARSPMMISVIQNVVNIVLSVLLVTTGRMKMEGIAIGTLVAQWTGFILALYTVDRRYPRIQKIPHRVFSREKFSRFFHISGDIFLRTLCLIAVTSAFTASGAGMGEITLAANTLVMQCFILYSYVMDGFAYAGESIGGHYIGAGRKDDFLALTHRLFLWGGGLAVSFTIAYALCGDLLFDVLTDQTDVSAKASTFLPFAAAIPIAGTWAFLFDGLYIGATATRPMLLSMAVATATFFFVRAIAPNDNRVLWFAFLAYLFLRGVVAAACYPQITRKISHTTKKI